jgi:hypothetical protein
MLRVFCARHLPNCWNTEDLKPEALATKDPAGAWRLQWNRRCEQFKGLPRYPLFLKPMLRARVSR